MRKVLGIFIFCSLALISCKKDKLKGESEILVGTWNWSYSIHDYGWCDNEQYSDSILAKNEVDEYKVEFLKEGKVCFFKNQLVQKKCRLVFNSFNVDNNGNFNYVIWLDNNKDSVIAGGGTAEKLSLTHFPFDPVLGCEDYKNYFEKN